MYTFFLCNNNFLFLFEFNDINLFEIDDKYKLVNVYLSSAQKIKFIGKRQKTEI